jgi:hypothetical protein
MSYVSEDLECDVSSHTLPNDKLDSPGVKTSFSLGPQVIDVTANE